MESKKHLTDELIAKITSSKKYRFICEDTILNICSEVEEKNRKSFEKAVRQKLHIIWQSYLGEPNYKEAEKKLAEIFSTNSDTAIKEYCWKLMQTHSSAKERLVVLNDDFYQRIFDITGQPTTVADLACALHPFCFRWMGLPSSVKYRAYDINKKFVDFINFYFELEGLSTLAEWRDIYSNPPDVHADVAFLFKMYHCIEHRKKGAGIEIIKNTDTDWIAISFPLQNLRGKKMNMYDKFAGPIEQLVQEREWELHQLKYDNEMLALIKKKKTVLRQFSLSIKTE